MKSAYIFAAAAVAATVAAQVYASAVNMTTLTTLAGAQVITFDPPLPGGELPGTPYDGILTIDSVSFAERFDGQILTAAGSFDVLTGTPTAGLSLVTGLPNQNLVVHRDVPGQSNQVLSGLGPFGHPLNSAIGEGSIATLFRDDQFAFGFDIVGGDGMSGETVTLNFFRRDGFLIESVVLDAVTSGSYAFVRDGNVRDIAGVSIHNTDTNGFAIDNVRYDAQTNGPPPGGDVPEPGSLALAGLALLGLAAARKRRSR